MSLENHAVVRYYVKVNKLFYERMTTNRTNPFVVSTKDARAFSSFDEANSVFHALKTLLGDRDMYGDPIVFKIVKITTVYHEEVVEQEGGVSSNT